MKKLSKILALTLALLMVLSTVSGLTVFGAAYTDEAYNAADVKFYYQNIMPVIKQVSAGESYGVVTMPTDSNGNCVIKTFENGMQGITYQQHTGTSSANNWNGNYLNFTFDTTGLLRASDNLSAYTPQMNDVMYISFYIRANQNFTVNDTVYTATSANNTSMDMYLGDRNDRGTHMSNLHYKETASDKTRLTPGLMIQSFGDWQKVSFGGKLFDRLDYNNDAGKLLFTLRSYQVGTTIFSYDIADFTVGIMKYTDNTTTDDKSYLKPIEYLCRTVESIKADTKYLATDDGYITATTEVDGQKVDTYTVITEDGEAPASVRATNNANGSFLSDLETKLTGNTLECYAPAYDKTGKINASYAQFADIDLLDQKPNNNDAKASMRASTVPNSDYKETFNVNAHSAYKIYNATDVEAVIGSGDTAYVDLSKSYIDAPEVLKDDIFNTAYKLSFVKQSTKKAQYGTYMKFNFDIPDGVEIDDLLVCNFYMRLKSPDDNETTNVHYNPTLYFTKGDGIYKSNGRNTQDKLYSENISSTNDGVIDTERDAYRSSYSWETCLDVKDGWKKYAVNVACDKDTDSLNFYATIPADGTYDVDVLIAQPQVAVIKNPAEKIPHCVATPNNFKTTRAINYSKLYDIEKIKVNGTEYAVTSDTTTIASEGKAITAQDIEIVSKYGDVPFVITDNNDGTYTIKVFGLAHNHPITTNDKMVTLGRSPAKYIYDDNAGENGEDTTKSYYDYEYALLYPVTFQDKNGDKTDIYNLSYLKNYTLNYTINAFTLNLLKDGADAIGNYNAAEGGSIYSAEVIGPRAETGKLVLAAYDGPNSLLKTGMIDLTNGKATVNLPKIANNGNVFFKVFIMDFADGYTPVTKMAEINSGTTVIPEI